MKNKKVIKASAGTGKTYRLSLEYISLLLQNVNFEEILVITFTKKATAEIREKIFIHLETIFNSEEDRKEILNNILTLNPNIKVDLDNLKNIYHNMLRNKDKVKIFTIDSFINTIFTKVITPFLNIYSYEVIDDYKNEELYEELLEEIISNPKTFEKMKQFFVENFERDVTKYVDWIQKIIQNRWKFLMVDRKKKPKKVLGDFVNQFQELLFKIEEIIKMKGKDGEELLDYIAKDYKDYFKYADKVKYFENNFKMYISDKNFWNGQKTRGKKIEGMVEDLKDSYNEFQINLSAYIYNIKILPLEDHIFDFANIIFNKYDEIKIRERKFTHTDISLFTYKYLYQAEFNLIENNTVSDYFYEVLGENISYLLIDEFQDTSVLQWRIFNPIINRADGVICVGDGKQSIYGWRGGECKLFENLDKILDCESDTLETSYRSKQKVIDFVNGFFTNIKEDWIYNPVKCIDKTNGGYVEALICDKEDEIKAKERIVESIKQEERDYGKIGIISRKNSELEEIAHYLRENEIPYIKESNLSIIEHRSIKPIYYLLRYVNYMDFFELLKFLRSDVINMKNNSLKEIVVLKDQINKFIFENPEIPLSDEIFLMIREIFRSNYYDMGKNIIEKFGFLDIFTTSNDAKNINRFFELMKGFESLSDFMEFLKENSSSEVLRQVGIEDINAIKLMTIHKSKGLEFDTQYYYWHLKPSSTNRGGDVNFYIRFTEDYTKVASYMFTHSSYNKVLSNVGETFFEEASETEFIEELNNLYVALTRPKTNLYIYLDAGKKIESIENPKGSVADEKYTMYRNALLNGLEGKCSTLNELTDQAVSIGVYRKDKIRKEKIGKKLDFDDLREYFFDREYNIVNKINEDNIIKGKIALENSKKEGLAIHYYLSFVKHNKKEELNYARKMTLVKYGNMFGELILNNLIIKANKFIENNKDIYDEEWDVYNEFAICELETGKEYRLDRLMINNKSKKVLILDYKTGSTMDKKQLINYKNLIASKIKNDFVIDTKFIEIK